MQKKSSTSEAKKNAKKNATAPSLIQPQQKKFQRFEGSTLFRHRLVLATLTHKSIEIDNIRLHGSADESGSDEKNEADKETRNKPGITDYELNFLRLLDRITNGSYIEINETATNVKYIPGTLTGCTKHIIHQCSLNRGVTYWLEPLLYLLPFSKEQTNVITLQGTTYHELDVSIDVIRGVLLPIIKRQFGMTDIRIQLTRRSLPPSGGGEVTITIPIVKQLRTIDMLDVGMIKRIRGLCYTIAMAPTLANRVRTECNNVLYNYISDVWIFNDSTKRHELQKHVPKLYKDKISAGYGLSLIAESTNGILLSVHAQHKTDADMTAEEFGQYVSKLLLQEISYGGTVDTTLQSIILIFMTLCTEDVSRVRLGRMTKHTVHILRLLKDMLGVTFKLKEDSETGTIFASCMGIGFSNVWRQAS
ncbi:RNA 3'-terminal phosphate cyclase family protein [Reticulomyxa filosa]|uniref:RNA 3'-terminal phosphate cyclase family protein n=1 Tax=Reticulomyxa filosa TaxID=46433 RepID=X6NSC7_RETFI|nr:RNA 3'-terminal phosphate cyclase family protein [Reticulomyxa filosa]|eukprot:ETO28242.1 RNA 3'-terminal phosphate cyclase family protein [Reticulomyxa filosa]